MIILESRGIIQRYYSKGKYEAVIGGLVLSLIFLGVATISALMLTFGYTDTFMSLHTWGFWMFIPGFFIMLGVFNQFYTNRNYQIAVKNAIRERRNKGTYKLEDLSLEIGIRPGDILKVLLDLRNKGLIRYRFNPSTGEIRLGESVDYAQSEEYTPPPRTIKEPLPKGKSYCQYCGYQIDTGSIFCESCGSKL